jgi:hypothetical protein
MAEATRQKTANLMGSLLNTKNMAILPPRYFHLCAPVTIVRNNKPADLKGLLSRALLHGFSNLFRGIAGNPAAFYHMRLAYLHRPLFPGSPELKAAVVQWVPQRT